MEAGVSKLRSLLLGLVWIMASSAMGEGTSSMVWDWFETDSKTLATLYI